MCESLNYPSFELKSDQKAQIVDLNKEWYELIKEYDKLLADNYVSDGFYPFYTQQSKKILFIGLEPYGLAGCDYIEILCNAYHKGTVMGKDKEISLNRHKLHRLLLYIAWGILHECPDFDKLHSEKTAKDIGCDFATSTGISFAFMNFSKISNETGATKADRTSINKFRDISNLYKHNLFAKEISILKPDLIIGLNLDENYDHIGLLSSQRWFGNSRQVCLQKLTTDYGEYDLIDTYHFAARGKADKNYFYDPIMEAYKSLIPQD